MSLSGFIKEKRRESNLTQVELAQKAGLGLRFVRDLEQGKKTLQMNKVNQLLELFGAELQAVEIKREM